MLLIILCLVTLVVFALYQGLRLSMTLQQYRPRRRYISTFARRRYVATTVPVATTPVHKSQTEALHEVIFKHD